MKRPAPFKGIKVCIASSWYPHAKNPFYCLFVHEFARRIHHLIGAEVIVVTTKHGPLDPDVELRQDISVFRVRSKIVLYPIEFLRVLKRESVNLVHVHAVDVIGSLSIIIAKLLGYPVIVTTHRADVLPTQNLVWQVLRRVALRICNGILAVSEATKTLTKQCGASEGRISVVYNSVNESIFRHRPKKYARELLALEEDAKIILFVGNLIPRKGVEYLIKALPICTSKTQNRIKLIIVGDGYQKEHLQNITRKLVLENIVEFAGRLPMDKLALYYNAANVFILPSLHEGHAVALLEAMASGLPVIATDVEGNSESISNGENGYLVSPRNTDVLAECLINILKNEVLRQRLGEMSIKLYKKKFLEGKQISKIVQVYESVLNNYAR